MKAKRVSFKHLKLELVGTGTVVLLREIWVLKVWGPCSFCIPMVYPGV